MYPLLASVRQKSCLLGLCLLAACPVLADNGPMTIDIVDPEAGRLRVTYVLVLDASRQDFLPFGIGGGFGYESYEVVSMRETNIGVPVTWKTRGTNVRDKKGLTIKFPRSVEGIPYRIEVVLDAVARVEAGDGEATIFFETGLKPYIILPEGWTKVDGNFSTHELKTGGKTYLKVHGERKSRRCFIKLKKTS